MLVVAVLASASWGVLPCCAYSITLETTNSATVGQSLQDYETNLLARAAVLLGAKKMAKNARCALTVNQDGAVVAAEISGASDAAFGKKLKAERFAKIPGLSSSGTLKLDFSFAELTSPPYRRENIAISGDTLIIGNETPAPSLSKPALPAPYSEDDRNFDKEIIALYNQLPSFMLDSRQRRGSNNASEDELLTEFQKCRKQENWAGACNTILIMLKKPVEKSDLAKIKEWLEILEDMSAKLGEGGKRSIAVGLIEVAHATNRPENVVGTELLLRQAEALLNRDSTDDPSIHLALCTELARHYQRARNQELERKANLDVLKYTLAVEPVDPRSAIRAYQTVVRDQISTRDAGAKKTLNDYRSFVEKRLGAEDLELIPVMVSSLKIETEEGKRAQLISSISKLVDSYRPTPRFDLMMGIRRDDTGRSAVAALRIDRYSREIGAQPLRDDENLALARLAYKLQLKTGGYDHRSFSNLCEVLDSQGKFEQVVTLYRETVGFLESRGADNELEGHLSSLRHGYASALKKVGGNETADSVMKSINEAEAKRKQAAIERTQSRIVELEKGPASDPMRLLETRLSLIQLSRGGNDKEIVTQLESMCQDLRRAPADRIRPGFDIRFIHMLRGNQRLVSEPVFEKPLINLFHTLDERIPGGISRNAIQALSFPRFSSSPAPNLDAVLKALGDRARADR
jgi:hypothetical protein